jgi:hypothetical protein
MLHNFALGHGACRVSVNAVKTFLVFEIFFCCDIEWQGSNVVVLCCWGYLWPWMDVECWDASVWDIL